MFHELRMHVHCNTAQAVHRVHYRLCALAPKEIAPISPGKGTNGNY
jgi:hypothetical protein